MTLRTLCFLLLLLNISCGNKSKSPSRERFTITPEEMEIVINNQDIFCASDDCPEGIARIFTVNFDDATNSSLCTGLLISPTMVMTNSHCLWAGDISLEKTCDGLYFAFRNPSPIGSAFTARCERIVFRDPRQNGQTTYQVGDEDYALVRLDREIPLSPINIQREGLTVGTEVHPIVIDHLDEFTAEIVKLNCRVEEVDSFGVVKLSNCPVISGNSGSAIVTDVGQVGAVLFGSDNPSVRPPGSEVENRDWPTSGFAFDMGHINARIGHLF